MQSICFYILSASKKNSSFSIESGLKYFISGSFISAIFLFGSSIIYGCLGTLNLTKLSLIFSEIFLSTSYQFNFLVYLGLICITTTLLFKIVCAPFHFWAPDVYEGSPLFSTIIFSVMPKVPLFYFIIKWISCLNDSFFYLKKALFFLGLFSCFWGTLLGLKQMRLKRLFVYSSIAQVGFILTSLSLATVEGFSKALIFSVVYAVTSIILWTFLVASYLSFNTLHRNLSESVLLTCFSATFVHNKKRSLIFLLAFFSLGGIPPLTGFLTKALILIEVLFFSKIYASSFFLIISSVSMFYYIRVLKISFFELNYLNRVSSFNVTVCEKQLKILNLSISTLLIVLILLFILPNELYFVSLYVIFSSVIF